MSLLSVKNLSHGFGGKDLYKGASFELFKGEHIGVVGQNGVGKSTLLKILLGEVVPDAGEVRWQPGISMGHLDQYAQIDGNMSISEYLHTAYDPLYAMEREMMELYELAGNGGGDLVEKAGEYQDRLLAAGFYGADSEVAKVASGLGLDALGMDRPVGELSGGQRAKAILAKLLLEKADVLLLDEPTNFLDKEHVRWFSEYLSSLENAYIVVSHDFDFLERISNGICDIEFGTIKKYHGGYSAFLKQKSRLREDYIRQYRAQQRMIERTEEFIRRNIAGVNTKMAQGRRKQLARVERIAPPSFAEKPVFRFREAGAMAAEALLAEKLEIGYYYPLLPPISFSVRGGQKMVITGFNGIGKSTLLKTLVGMIDSLSGRFRFSDSAVIGYYEQELSWEDPGRTPLQIIADAYPRMSAKEIRRVLAQCGVREEHARRPVDTLSGGEQSKVKLCRLILSPCNFLILDEPTNHFDAETKEAFQKAIEGFTGSVILVSHEEKFYRDLADKVLDIEASLN